MPSLQYIADYFTTPQALLVLGVVSGTAILSYAAFRRARRPSARIAFLAAIFCATLSMWLFVASSLLFCEVYDYLYPPAMLFLEVKIVLGWATVFTLGLGIPLTVLVSVRSSRATVHGLPVTEAPAGLLEAFDEARVSMGIPEAKLVAVRTKRPTCFSVGTSEKTVVLSDDLADLLEGDDLRSIIAHELAHLKHGDTRLKSLLGVYCRILRFDPVIRLAMAAIHREMEFRADERVVRLIGRAAPLISALSQLDRLGGPSGRPSLGYESQLIATHPPTHVRIARLRRAERA